jgi:RimJ/RimL family protein N-acetyltransferase
MIVLDHATVADVPLLTAAHAAAFAEDKALYGQGPAGCGDADWHQARLADHIYLVLRSAQQLIGGMLVEDQGNGHAYLHSFFIDPAHQGHGYGQQALRLLEQHFPHVVRWSLHTPHRSYRNHHLYEKIGYHKIGETRVTDAPGLVKDFVLFEYERHITG